MTSSIVYEVKSSLYFEPLLININSIYDEILELNLQLVFLMNKSLESEFITYIEKYNKVFTILQQPCVVYSLDRVDNYIYLPILSIVLPNTLKYLLQSVNCIVDETCPVVEVINSKDSLQSNFDVYLQCKIYMFDKLSLSECIDVIKYYYTSESNSVKDKN